MMDECFPGSYKKVQTVMIDFWFGRLMPLYKLARKEMDAEAFEL